MATNALPIERSAWTHAKWIISSRDDLIYFIGSVLASYALLFLHKGVGLSMLLLYWIWIVIFDGPHIFGTVSRTYLDATERAGRGRLFYGSLFFFALGPAMVFAGQGKAFFAFAGIWAYYHLVKQHYGFMVLYKKKNKDLQPIDNLIDRGFLLIAFNYPFVRFLYGNSEARRMLPFPIPIGMEVVLEKTLVWIFLASLAIFVGRQLHKWIEGEPLNIPKLLLLSAAIPMHIIVLSSSLGPKWVVPVLTIYHNIQYHRLIWFHNKNKYQDPASPSARYGPASFVSRKFLYYAGFGILFTFAYRIPNHLLRDYEWTLAFFWGFAFVHYYLDSKIWRVRRDAKLNESLRMASA